MAQGHGVRRTQQTLDTLLELEDGAAAITADGNGSAIIDLHGGAGSNQPNPPLMHADLLVDVSAITTGGASGETYIIHFQGSSSATFASDIENLAAMPLGDVSGTALVGSAADVDSDIGRYVIPVTNEANGRTYRFVRLRIDVGGTAPSITFVGNLAIRVGL